jgi:hypothetical protein
MGCPRLVWPVVPERPEAGLGRERFAGRERDLRADGRIERAAMLASPALLDGVLTSENRAWQPTREHGDMAETRAAAAGERNRMRRGTGLKDRARRARIRASFSLHRHVLSNRSSRRAFAASAVKLSDVQQQVVSALQADGFAKTSFDELIGDTGLWNELWSDMEAFKREVRPDKKHKDYLLKRSGKAGRSFRLDDPWLRYATVPTLLDVVNSYLQLHSKLVDVDQWYTLPMPAGSERIASQRWHRDGRDMNIVKVFTYFSDVDREAGALEYVLGSPPGRRYGHLWPWDPIDSGYHPTEEEMDSRVASSDRAFATGPTGTIVLCNTTGFHRGGYASKPRVNSMFSYVSPASVATLRDRRFTVEPNGAGSSLPEAARLALT